MNKIHLMFAWFLCAAIAYKMLDVLKAKGVVNSVRRGKFLIFGITMVLTGVVIISEIFF